MAVCEFAGQLMMECECWYIISLVTSRVMRGGGRGKVLSYVSFSCQCLFINLSITYNISTMTSEYKTWAGGLNDWTFQGYPVALQIIIVDIKGVFRMLTHKTKNERAKSTHH